MLRLNRIIAKDIEMCTYYCYIRCETLIAWTGLSHYHAQLGLPEKGHTIKGLVIYNGWDLGSLELIKGLALGCCQPSPGVWKKPAGRKWKGENIIIVHYHIPVSRRRRGICEKLLFVWNLTIFKTSMCLKLYKTTKISLFLVAWLLYDYGL